MPTRTNYKLIDEPGFYSESWKGYEHFQDETKMEFNRLTYPSQNCSIPIFDKILPDRGKDLYGQIFTENRGINGNLEKFKNLAGIEMEIREWSSVNPNLLDVIEIGYQNTRLVFAIIAGAFSVGETVSGQTSGASGIIVSITGTVMMLSNIIGEFDVGEIILGLTSGATATTVLVPEIRFHQITENLNPIPRGLHEYYFDGWFDTNLKPSLSRNLPRAIWVNGYMDTSNPVKGAVYSWTGGIAVITSLTATNLNINPLTTWRSLGFSEDASGNAYVVVNGVSYQLATPADLDTSSIDVTNTAGVSIGDTATARIEVDEAPIPFDVCRQVKGYMYYGNWTTRKLYQSNAFNRPSNYTITFFQGGLLNDLVIDAGSNPYTGTTESVYHIVIDSVEPDVEIQTWSGSGFNDALFDTSGYTATNGVLNHYKVSMMADALIALTAVVAFVPGETIKGSVSNAEAIVVANETVAGVTVLGVKMITGFMFDATAPDNIVGSTTAGPGVVSQAQYQNWIQYTKNDVVVNVNTGSGLMPIAPLQSATAITLSDGLTIQFANFRGHAVGDVFALDIRKGGIDTFQWQKDGGAFTSNVPINAGNFQTLSDGIEIKFLNANGHLLGDYWDITAIPQVARAWDSFYYALPVRRPGEGYIYQLPSNFWTMDTQEESMYVNGSYGEWSVVTTTLSADLQSEAVSLQPLKQSGALKVIHPYMTGHINDDLIFVSIDKRLQTLGRQKFLEKPQSGYLSELVNKDFQKCNFVGGRIKYLNKNLYVSSPEDAMMHCYDTHQQYWNPPKTFPEVGILSIVGDNLICHSNTRNQTFTMFTSDNGDNGQGYTVEIRTPYRAPNGRWNSTMSGMSFTEGYITGNPTLIHTVYLGVAGCGGIFPHEIDAIICLAPDRAPFGQGPFGSHSFGSDLDVGGSYFNEIYKAYAPRLEYYFISLGITCTANSHTWSILGLGMNQMDSNTGNNKLVNPQNLAINNV